MSNKRDKDMPNSRINSVVANKAANKSLGKVEEVSIEKEPLLVVPHHRLMSQQRKLCFEVKSMRNPDRSVSMAMCSSYAVRKFNPEMAPTADYLWNIQNQSMVKSGAWFSCGNVHCLSCSQKRQREEQQQLFDVLKYYTQRTDVKIIFLTLTHSKQRDIGLNYEIQWKFISKMNLVINNLNIKYGDKSDYSDHSNRVDWRTILEQTFSANWMFEDGEWFKSVHCHQHALLFVGSNVPEKELKAKLAKAYRKHLQSYGVLKEQQFYKRSFDWEVPQLSTVKNLSDLSKYLASKMTKIEQAKVKGLSYEATSSRNKGLGIGELVQRIYLEGCSEDIRVYREFISVQRGKQSTRMSKGYRELAKYLEEHQNDIEALLIEEQLEAKWQNELDAAVKAVMSFDDWSWIERIKMEEEVRKVTEADAKVSIHPTLVNAVIDLLGSVERLDDIVYSYFSQGMFKSFVEFLEDETQQLLEYDWLDDYIECKCSTNRRRSLRAKWEVLRDKIKNFVSGIDWAELVKRNDEFKTVSPHKSRD